MKQKKDWSFLKILTKEEIIEFLKEEMIFHAPEERDVIFFKWQYNEKNLLNREEKLLKDGYLKNKKEIIEIDRKFNENFKFYKKYKKLSERPK